MSDHWPHVEIRSLATEDREQALSLLGAGPERTALWDWQFGDRRSDPGGPLLAAYSAGRIVGFNGAMPVRVWLAGQEQEAIWSCDFVVARGFRGRGIGTALKQRQADLSPLVLVLGISDLAAPVLRRSGWLSASRVSEYILLRRPRSPRAWAWWGRQQANRLAGVRVSQERVPVRLCSHLPTAAELDELWGRVRGQYGRAVCRTASYLDWRYRQHPLARYRFILLGEAGALRSVAVVREEGETVHLVDYLGELDVRILRRLMASVCSFFAGALRLRCVTSDARLGRALRDAGFARRNSTLRFYVRSRRAGDDEPVTGWFIMAGDSDGDMLAAARAGRLLNTGGVAGSIQSVP